MYKRLFIFTSIIFATKANDSIALTAPEELTEIIKHHNGDFGLITRGGSTRPVTDVFYNIPITNTKLSGSGDGLELTQSGRYYIANNLRRPIASSGSFLKITGQNIVVDMNGCTIQGELSTATNIGIEIAPSVKNTKLINGSFTSIKGPGIKIDTSCKTVEIKDVTITACGDFGVWSNGTSGNVVNNLTMDNVHITDGNGEQDSSDNAFGAYITYTNNATINNCSFNNQLPTTGTNSEAYGIGIVSSSDITLNNCTANSNASIGTDPGYGFVISACTNIHANNCSALKNSSNSTGACYGFSLSGATTNCTLNNCIAKQNSAGSTGNSVGYYADSTTSHNNEFINCLAQDNSSAGAGSSYGFYSAGGDNWIFKNCSAIGHSSSGTTAAGFFLATTNVNYQLTNCTSSANATSHASGNVYGFYGSAMESCLFDHCKATGNIASGTGGNTYGFHSVGGTSNVWDGCEATGQKLSSTSAVSGIVAGIAVITSEKLSTIKNGNFSGNSAVGAATSNTCKVFGILLGGESSGSVDKMTISNNQIKSNAVTATNGEATKLVGLYDNTADCNSLISGNTIALNGTNRLDIGSAPDFNIDSAGYAVSNAVGGLNIYLTYSNGQNIADIVVETDVSNMQALSTGLEGWTNYLIVPNEAA
jgi:hypothetical protein